MTDNIDLFVTNYNKNFTGVSATAANVLLKQAQTYNLRLVGCSLPECPKPVSVTKAYYFAKAKPKNKPSSVSALDSVCSYPSVDHLPTISPPLFITTSPIIPTPSIK